MPQHTILNCHLLSRCGGALLLMAGLMLTPVYAATNTNNAVPSSIASKPEQRKAYAKAKQAISVGNYTRYRALSQQLANYPLQPYLEYQYINRRLSRLPYSDVDAFFAQHADTYLGEKLNRKWVGKLAQKSRWKEVVRYYDPTNSNTELACYYLRARLATGDTSAFADVAPLWNVDHSQPKACDPLFKQWMDAGHLSSPIAWQRFSKALKARKRMLAKYIAKQMTPSEKSLADLYLQVDRNPKQLRHMRRFSAQTPQMQTIIMHGLTRLARRDAELALDLWQRYDAQQLFDEQARNTTQHYIATRLLRQGFVAQTEALIAATPNLSSTELIQWLARDALRKQNWSRVNHWVSQLAPELQQSHRWQYWKARSLAQHSDAVSINQAHSIYNKLALTRSFYGFLAADIMGLDYQLVDKPVNASEALVDDIKALPGVRRARELYILGNAHQARSEWFHATKKLDEQHVAAAGKLAERWGWHRNSIQAMIQVKYWDDLKLRFPLAYREHVDVAATDTDISPHLLYAIARQESAFSPDARSRAGALGLMQLLPSTARQTARRAGMRFSTYDLLQPKINITLGSRYLNELLGQFNGNRILATAAYNAGPTRVKKWLTKKSDTPLPYDIWIETIPYRETRGYVQNVLAYSVIYGYRLGDKKPFITQLEAKKTL